jgi:hypothetical protein
MVLYEMPSTSSIYMRYAESKNSFYRSKVNLAGVFEASVALLYALELVLTLFLSTKDKPAAL